MDGQKDLVTEINHNINNFLSSKLPLKLGISAEVIVRTKAGRLVYPDFRIQNPLKLDSGLFSDTTNPEKKLDTVLTAKKNWKIMREGLQLIAKISVPRNSWLANGILTLYIMAFIFFPYAAYLASARKAKLLEISKQQAIDQANKKLNSAQNRLIEISIKENKYQEEISRLKSDLDLAGNKVRETEDEAFSEMVKLDQRLNENIQLKEELELEVLRLEEELNKIDLSFSKRLSRNTTTTQKRFKTLYKNIKIHPRAVQGFLELEPDMQLKAEELIHNINEDKNKIIIKRKVFSKKRNMSVLECVFGRKGRLYWESVSGAHSQILVIGTKNTQTRDLAFIDTL